MPNAKPQIKELLSESDAVKYAGQYVCTADFNSTAVIAADYNAVITIELANDCGHTDPVLFYVPRLGEVFIF